MKITFPDGRIESFKDGITGNEIAAGIGEGLHRAALALLVDGQPYDLFRPLHKDCNLRIVTIKDKEGLEILRHSTAHVLAQAVTELFPNVKLTIGPVIENGFYYDFEADPFTPEDLEKIELRMKEVIKRKLEVKRREVSKDEALKLFSHNPFKIELIEEHEEKGLSIYEQGGFMDLCRGPHLPNTDKIAVESFKLTHVSASYWRGDSSKASLQRIYAVQFASKKELEEFLTKQEEASKRDHRKLGQQLDLFSFHDFSPGSAFFHPKGTVIFNELQKFIRGEYMKRGYKEIITPNVFSNKLWKISGHWDNYKENMFLTQMDGEDAALKPMNCPSHCLFFKNTTHSYRELPMRIADFGVLHRNELKGTLGGMTRVRKFQQDDSHIFATVDQIQSEVGGVIDFVHYVYKVVFGFEYQVELSTKPANAIGSAEVWEKAEDALAQALKTAGIKYKINPGDGAFYGPKIDFKIMDALGRPWQCATIQCDFNLPERFDLTYEGDDGKKHRPVMIHRAVLGSIDRFMGVLIEYFAGKFPLWLSPVQIIFLPIADRHMDAVKKFGELCMQAGIRFEIDDSHSTLNKKIRNAELQYIPYILVVGDKEMENDSVNIRTRDNVVHGEKGVQEFISEVVEQIQKKL